MTIPRHLKAKPLPLFGGYLVPILHLRLVEALSVEYDGNPTAIERALHNLGRQIATPLLIGLVNQYGEPTEDYYPSKPELFLNRIDEYLAKNWELATGKPPSLIQLIDKQTVILRTELCPLSNRDVIESGLKLRYCELISGVLEGLLQHWIDNLKLPYQVTATQTAGQLQGNNYYEFRIRFGENLED